MTPLGPDLDRLRDLLAELDDTWLTAGLPIAHHARPGLTGDEVRRQCRALDLEPPAEVVTWFEWHDGARVHHAIRPENCVGVGNFVLLSLTEALERVVSHWQPNDPTRPSWGPSWRDGWIPLAATGTGTSVVVDCRLPADAPSPVRIFHRDDDAHADVVDHPSVAALVEDWIAQIRASHPAVAH